MANESKKQYVIKGKIVGTYESDTVDIDISLSDSELERIKDLIKSSDSKDLRWVIKDEFPELYEQINDQLQDAAYDYYAQSIKTILPRAKTMRKTPTISNSLVKSTHVLSLRNGNF